MTTAIDTIERQISYNRDTRDYDVHIKIDGQWQYIGSAPTRLKADRLADEYAFNYYTDNHTPETAAQIAAESFEPEPSRSEVGPIYHPGDINPALCSFPGCTRPATTRSPIGWPVCDECDAAGMARLKRAILGGSEPAPPVDDGPDDNYGGFRAWPRAALGAMLNAALSDDCPGACVNWSSGPAARIEETWACPGCGRELPSADASCASCAAPTATRYVSVGWDGKNHPDLAVIAAQVLLPLAHLGPAIAMNDDDPYLITGHTEKIAAPPDDHAIVTGLIDALNEIAVQLPARPDSIYATLHIDGEMYTVQHNGPPRSLDAVPTAPQYVTLLA